MLARALASLALLLAACAGSGGGGTDTVIQPGLDSVSPAPDGLLRDSAAGSLDSVGGPDLFGGPDLAADADTGLGLSQFGDPCRIDGDCASGICWASAELSGCTIPCESDADCESEDYSLQCTRLASGVWGCEPRFLTVPVDCADHRDCRYPYECREDVGCALPECRFDADCAADKRCNQRTRRCESRTCGSNAQCTFPLDFCLEGSCQPARCTLTEDCPSGLICERFSGDCKPTDACDEEGNCAAWNKACVEGICDFDLCRRAILPGEEEPPPACEDASDICDPMTGRCMSPCTSHAECAVESRCHSVHGWCYANRAPFAVAALELGGSLVNTADVPVGQTVIFDGSQSVDPDGTNLTYHWNLRAVPPGSLHDPALAIPTTVGPRPTLELDARGTYVVDLVVMDDGGLFSRAAEAVVRAY